MSIDHNQRYDDVPMRTVSYGEIVDVPELIARHKAVREEMAETRWSYSVDSSAVEPLPSAMFEAAAAMPIGDDLTSKEWPGDNPLTDDQKAILTEIGGAVADRIIKILECYEDELPGR